MRNPPFTKLDKLFSGFVLMAIVLLAVYMFVRIGVSGLHFLEGVFSGELLNNDTLDAFSGSALQSIAEVIVLIKAYRILISYVHTHHVSVEYIVEISIIAAAVELLFAMDTHSIAINVTLGAFGLANLLIYVMYFHPDHDEELHHLKHGKK